MRIEKKAFQSIEQLRAAFRELDPAPSPRESRAQFEAIEQGIGAHWHRKPTLARIWLERAIKITPSPIARDLLTQIRVKHISHLEVELATAGIPITAIDPLDASTVPEVPVPRVFQNAHDFLLPTPVVRSVIEPALPVMTSEQQVEQLLRRRRYREALDQVDALLGDSPDEPRAHHLRGKALLALGRLPDARAAFDRACTLRPQLLEAMLLRREVDRVMSATQASAGIANPMVNTLPDHLADLRDVLVSGRIVDAIQFLRRPAYDDDTVARLLLAHLLCVDGRADEALDVLSTMTADEAHDLRARALTALGRDAEAEVEMSTYLRLIEQRSDRRIGSK